MYVSVFGEERYAIQIKRYALVQLGWMVCMHGGIGVIVAIQTLGGDSKKQYVAQSSNKKYQDFFQLILFHPLNIILKYIY